MGYCTLFGLTILDDQGVEIDGSEIIEYIRDNSSEAEHAFTETGDGNARLKWYECRRDFTRFSKKFPNNILMVSGYGEDSDDYWICYFMNGKMQNCPGVLTYEPLDLSLISTEKIKPRTLKT